MSVNDSSPAKEKLRAAIRETVDGEIDPIYQDVTKLLDIDKGLLRTLGELKRGRQLTIREQALLQNILYGLISTQGDVVVNLLKTLQEVKSAQYDAFEREYAFAEAMIRAISEVLAELITPLAEESGGTRQIVQNLRDQLDDLARQKREIELTVPPNVEKELKAWVEERERAKKASEKYTG